MAEPERRLVYFLNLNPTPIEVEYTPASGTGATFPSSWVLTGALGLDLLPRPGADTPALFRPVVTEAVLRAKVACNLKHELARHGWFDPTRDRFEPIHAPEDGGTRAETIIQAMANSVREGDQVVVEPTNGLRSISFALVFGALFLRALRAGVRVEHLVYGEMGRPCPIHNIADLLELADWTADARVFADALVPGPLLDRLRARAHADPALVARLERFQRALSIPLMPALGAVVGAGPLQGPADAFAAGATELVNRRLELGALRPELGTRLDSEWLAFSIDTVKRLSEAGRPGDAVRALREWCVDVALLGLGETKTANWRTQAYTRSKGESLLHRSRTLPSGDDRLHQLAAIFEDVRHPRNAAGHVGYVSARKAELVNREDMRGFIERARVWLAAGAPNPGCWAVVRAQGLFVNLSNHPSAGWSDDQRAAARVLADSDVVHDVPFPQVDPRWDAPQVLDAALRAASLLPETATHAMVQGEPTLCVAIVACLRERGVQCFVATTERDTEDAPRGKLSRFRFVRFREWPGSRPGGE